MTPIKWVHKGELVSKEEADENAKFVPVLTLTDLEAWLIGQKSVVGTRDAHVMNHLLAEVQAWKEKP